MPLEEAGLRAGHLLGRSSAHPFSRFTVSLDKPSKSLGLGEIARAAKAAECYGRHRGAHRDDHVARAVALQLVGGRRLQMDVGAAALAESARHFLRGSGIDGVDALP